MKTSVLFISVLLLAQFSFAQSYQAEITDFPSDPGKALFWQGDKQTPALKFMATKNSNEGDLKKGRIFLGDEYAFSVERKGNIYFLYNRARETQLVRHSVAYVTLDGTELKRKRSITGDKIMIVHPDGRILAEGKIKLKILGKHVLSLDIKEGTPYSKEIAAMLSVDLMESIRHRYDLTPALNYTATTN